MRRLQSILAWLLLIIGLVPVVSLAVAWLTVKSYGCITVSSEGCALLGAPLGFVVVGLVFVAGYWKIFLPLAVIGLIWLWGLRQRKPA